MGLAWWLPDIESPREYFKFLPRNDESTGLSPSKKEIIGLEKKLLSDFDDGSASHLAFEIIRIREQQKDWLLSQLQEYVKSSLNHSNFLRCPPSADLISPLAIELIEDMHKIRSVLLEKLQD